MVSRGRPPPLGKGATRAPDGPAGGNWRQHAYKEIRRNTGSPRRRCRDTNRQPVRDRPGRLGVAERPVVPERPGNAGGGKGPWFKGNVKGARAGRLA